MSRRAHSPARAHATLDAPQDYCHIRANGPLKKTALMLRQAQHERENACGARLSAHPEPVEGRAESLFQRAANGKRRAGQARRFAVAYIRWFSELGFSDEIILTLWMPLTEFSR